MKPDTLASSASTIGSRNTLTGFCTGPPPICLSSEASPSCSSPSSLSCDTTAMLPPAPHVPTQTPPWFFSQEIPCYRCSFLRGLHIHCNNLKVYTFLFLFFLCPAWWTTFSFHSRCRSYVSVVTFAERPNSRGISLVLWLLTSSQHPLVWDEKCSEKNDTEIEKRSKTQRNVHKGRQRHNNT